jgi:hypothetical protein
MSDTNTQGHRLFYGMSIECRYGNKYPWVVTIENFYAPGQQSIKGGLTPKIDQKSDFARGVISLSDMEWTQMIDCMESNKRNFETLWYSRLYKESIETDKANYKAYKEAQEAMAKEEKPSQAA